MMSLRELAQHKKLLICVVHLPPLPGSARWCGQDLDEIVDFAVKCAKNAELGGADAVIIENFGDNPFKKIVTDVETIVSMTIVVKEVRRSISIPVGVNLLRNSCREACIIAALTKANFIRCNAYCEVISCPEGIIEPVAHDVVKTMTYLRRKVEVMADIFVKHATPLHTMTIREVIDNCVDRCLADFIIVTGSKTGEAPDLQFFHDVLKYSKVPVLVGSGIDPENVRYYKAAHGYIVGTYIKDQHGVIDPEKVRRLRTVIDSLSVV